MTGRHLPLALFPQEILCCIWKELPFSSRVAITHTCRFWRSVALSCPGLWTDVTFFTAIKGDRRVLGYPHRGWRDIHYRDGTTNIGSAQDILARGFQLADPGRPLTTVRTFSLRPYCVPSAVIHHAVAVLPNLLSLHIDFADLMQNAKPTADPAPVRQLAANIPSVTLTSVPDRCAAWMIAPFHEPARPTLALERCLSPFNVELCAILGDLGQDIRLRVVTTHDRRVVITGIDAQGLERRIDSARDADLSPLFADNYLNPDDVVEVSVRTSLLPRIVQTFNNVIKLILHVDDLGFLDAHPLPALPAFPALRTLTLLDGLDLVQRFAGDVSDLVHALDMPVPLERSISITVCFLPM